jgi:hypothetical protein
VEAMRWGQGAAALVLETLQRALASSNSQRDLLVGQALRAGLLQRLLGLLDWRNGAQLVQGEESSGSGGWRCGSSYGWCVHWCGAGARGCDSHGAWLRAAAQRLLQSAFMVPSRSAAAEHASMPAGCIVPLPVVVGGAACGAHVHPAAQGDRYTPCNPCKPIQANHAEHSAPAPTLVTTSPGMHGRLRHAACCQIMP